MARMILSFTLLLFTSMSFAQQTPEITADQLAENIIRSYSLLDPQKKSFDYHRFQLILEHIGTIQLQYLPTENANVQVTLRRESQELFQKRLSFLATAQSIENREKARDIVLDLQRFSTSLNALQAEQLVQIYNSDGYSIRRSLQHSMYQLPAEIARFAAAMVVVRLASCFGTSTVGSMQQLMTLQTPDGLRSSPDDPACITEIGEMLTSPIFYIGFSAFIAGSPVANALALKALKKIDPARGPVTQGVIRHVVPNLGMAIGFLSDHLLVTLLHNPDISKCALSIPKNFFAQFQTKLDQQVVSNNGTEESLDFYGTFGDPTCRRAGRYVNSDQFISEEMGVGIVGLLTTATTLSASTAALAALRNATALKNISFAFTATGWGGIVIGTVRMVAFLGLFEVLHPYVLKTYHTAYLEPKLDGITEDLIKNYETIKEGNGLLNLRNKEECSRHYTGFRENGEYEVCSKIPLLTEVISFADYSKIWRSRKILGEFNMYLTRWRKKLTSFINNYFAGMEQIQHLSRSREVFLTGESEYEKTYYDIRMGQISEILNNMNPDPTFKDNLLAQLQIEVEEHIYNPEYQSPMAELSLDRPERQAFELLVDLLQRDATLYYHRNGDLFVGINGENRRASDSEVQQLAADIVRFFEIRYVDINLVYMPREAMYSDDVDQVLESLGVPLNTYIVHQSFLMNGDAIVRLVQSKNPNEVAMGFLLFNDWKYFMTGQNPKRFIQYGEVEIPEELRFNPQGLPAEQYEIYTKISAALEHFNPLFAWEQIYLDSTWTDLGKREKTQDDYQWSEVSYGIDAKALSSFALVQMICGTELGFLNSLFSGDRDGLGLEFTFPHLRNDSVCRDLIYPVRVDFAMQPSPVRSVYAAPEGLYMGLHQAYIQAPEQARSPLLFDTENQAGEWWNENVKPDALRRLQQMEADYTAMVEENFFPFISSEEIAGSWFERLLKNLPWLFWVDGGERQLLKNYTSTNSLTLNFLNELYHYKKTLESVATVEESSRWTPLLNELAECVVNLLDSLPEKNYTEVKSQCDSQRIRVIDEFIYQNQKFSDNDIEAMLKLTDEELASGSENANMKDRVVLEVGLLINSIINEIDSYNETLNKGFKFNLDSGD